MESMIKLADAAAMLGVHRTTVYRWTTIGVDGNKLETWRFGRTPYTSREALTRFSDALTSPAPRRVGAQKSTRSASREKEIERVQSRIVKAGC